LVAVTLAVIAMSLATITGTHGTTTVHAQSILNTAASQDCTGGNYTCNFCAVNPGTAACQPASGSAAMLGAEAMFNGAADIAAADAQSNVGSARTFCPGQAWLLIGQSMNLPMYLGC
jgi:hypothetical protein